MSLPLPKPLSLAGKIVLLNGPSGSGKDTIANYLRDTIGCATMAFKDPLYKAAFGISAFEDFDVFLQTCQDRVMKEQSNNLCYDLTPRELLITVSERMCKPVFGKSFFGLKAAKAINLYTLKTCGYVFSDCGFVEEIMPLIESFGQENVYVVQFTGQGKVNFNGDSRNWVYTPHGDYTIRMPFGNDGSLNDFAAEIIRRVV